MIGNSPTVRIMRGISGAGKSTYAREHKKPQDIIVSRDIFRQAFGLTGKGVLDTDGERAVTGMEMDAMRRAIRQGRNVWVDNTNLDKRNAEKYATEAHILGADYAVRDINVDPDKAIARRQNTVPEKVIRRQYQRFLNREPVTARVERIQPIPQGANLPPAFIFDIDGTLAHIDPKSPRSPYDGGRVKEDLLDGPTASILEVVHGNALVLVVSGRDAKYRDATEKWLAANYVYPDRMYMRREGDKRHDAQVKYEILRDQIAPNYQARGVFDDRTRVVNMWRTAGVKTFQVADPAVCDF
jgi:predicted kinase